MQVKGLHDWLQTSEIQNLAKHKFEIISMDIAGPFPHDDESDFKYILVMVDEFSGLVGLKSLVNKSAKEVNDALVNF